MIKTNFKTLINYGMYVDANLLNKGIYLSEKPFICSIDETIDTLIDKGREVQKITGTSFISDNYFENLSKCTLIEIEIIIKK